jgi:hypothetical protein
MTDRHPPDGLAIDATAEPDSLEAIRDDARYARERLALYRAKVVGPRPTSLARLRELQHNAERAEARLANVLSRDLPS